MYYECICIIGKLFDQLIMNLSEFRYIGKLSIQEKVGMKYQHRDPANHSIHIKTQIIRDSFDRPMFPAFGYT